MGAGSSKQRMGERVLAGRSKYKEAVSVLDERVSLMSSETLLFAVDGIMESLSLCSPFLEGTLLVAFKAETKKIEDRILRTTEKVLTAPIVKEEWEWFKAFMLSSSVWFLRTADDTQFMFQKMVEIASGLSEDITAEMDSIYVHLQSHKDWNKLMLIKNQTIVSRQDDDAVGLLKDEGIVGVLEMKEQDEDGLNQQKLKDFVESNLAVTDKSRRKGPAQSKPQRNDIFLRRNQIIVASQYKIGCVATTAILRRNKSLVAPQHKISTLRRNRKYFAPQQKVLCAAIIVYLRRNVTPPPSL